MYRRSEDQSSLLRFSLEVPGTFLKHKVAASLATPFPRVILCYILRGSLNFSSRFYAFLLVFTVCLPPCSSDFSPRAFTKLSRPFEVYHNVPQTLVYLVVVGNGSGRKVVFTAWKNRNYSYSTMFVPSI